MNQLWSQLIIEELVRNSVTQICISPGSRSTPLVLAAAANDKVNTTVHFDERGMAFYALGYAKATGKQAALICTSGTAVANLYPAVIEAGMSFTPMIILSADRPPELRDTGASQTIDQVRIFGDYLRWSFDLPAPDQAIDSAFVLTTVDQACYRARRSPAGPVQLNCPFREPLVPTDTRHDLSEYLSSIGRWSNSVVPYTIYSRPACHGSVSDMDIIVDAVRNAKRGLIVAGTLPPYIDVQPVVALAERLHWPLVADIHSGARFCGLRSTAVVSHFDLFLRVEEFRRKFQPDLILHFGGPPISKHLARYLAEGDAEQIMVSDHPHRHDPDHMVTRRVESDPIWLATELAARLGRSPSALHDAFVAAEQASAAVIESFLTSNVELVSEFGVAREIFEQATDERGIFLATSMPIREADAFAAAGDSRLHVCANRGVNGIDGTIASAVGFAAGRQSAVTLLIGDLAFLHDLNSLALVGQSAQPITIVVINNDGGGIFSFLPVAGATEHFERFFGTPHGVDFAPSAAQFGIDYCRVDTLSGFVSEYGYAITSGVSSIIEVTSERARNLSQHQQLWDTVRGRVTRALTELTQ
jgi:2-succinyl-5-enolpyruvyl-6-hydroxy-3-cyclohexene-1-carboxylate synthase